MTDSGALLSLAPWSAVRQWWRALGLSCRIVFSFIVLVYLVELLPLSVGSFCLGPSSLSVASVLLSTFSHANLLHIVVNMAAWLSLAWRLEQQFGSGPLLIFVVTLAAVTQVWTLTTLAVLGTLVAPQYWHTCTVGFSGVLFGLLTFEAYIGEGSTIALCGQAVPRKLYPWLVLLLVSLLFPSSSFICHLGGVLCGIAMATWVASHPPSCTPCCGWMASLPSYCEGASPSARPFPAPGMAIKESTFAPTAPSSTTGTSTVFVPFSGRGHTLRNDGSIV